MESADDDDDDDDDIVAIVVICDIVNEINYNAYNACS